MRNARSPGSRFFLRIARMQLSGWRSERQNHGSRHSGRRRTGGRVLTVTAALLEAKDVCKSYGAVRALRNVSFELRRGEVHALAGENGAGKSTLIKVITGVVGPDSGTLTIQGAAVDRLS